MEGRAGRSREGCGVEPGQVEDRCADGLAGDPAGQSAAANNLGRAGLCAVDRGSGADALVDDQLPDGCLAAPEHLRKEIKTFLIKRSEEHTSELQSLMRISYAVFCLKKKQITQMQIRYKIDNTKSTDVQCSINTI